MRSSLSRLGARLGQNRIRLIAALSSYCVLAIIATFLLNGFLRTVCYFFFAFLAVKTIRHAADHRETDDSIDESRQ
jgi:hypothetical protein